MTSTNNTKRPPTVVPTPEDDGHYYILPTGMPTPEERRKQSEQGAKVYEALMALTPEERDLRRRQFDAGIIPKRLVD